MQDSWVLAAVSAFNLLQQHTPHRLWKTPCTLMTEREWKEQITSRCYYENNFHPRPRPHERVSRTPRGLQTTLKTTAMNYSIGNCSCRGRRGLNYVYGWNSNRWKCTKTSTVIASGWRWWAIFSLIPSCFSVVHVHFLYGQNDIAVLRKGWGAVVRRCPME